MYKIIIEDDSDKEWAKKKRDSINFRKGKCNHWRKFHAAPVNHPWRNVRAQKDWIKEALK